MSEDLIRRSDAIKAIEPYLDYIKIIPLCGAKPYVREAVYGIRSKIKFIPTIEPKRGWWETVFMSEATGWDVSIAGRDPIYGHRCSICKEEAFINDVGEEMLTNFCPNCGADMRGAENE